MIFKNGITFGLVLSAIILTACDKQSTDAPVLPDAPDAAIQAVITEFAKGNGGILWAAMPLSYQGDVTGLAKLAGTKVDPEVYDTCFALLARLADVADQQKAFILNSSFLADATAEKLEQIDAALPALVGLVKTIATCDLASSAGLQNFDGQNFCNTTVSKLAQYSESLAQLAGEAPPLSDFLNTQVTVVAADELQATLSAVVPGQAPVEHVFTKVEERWVPVEMANQWAAGITESTANLEAMSADQMAAQKPQIMGVLTMVDGVLTQIAAAETQEQFDQSLKGAMMPLMGMMMMGQSFGSGE